MKIGIVSDVHDNLRHLVKVIEFLNSEKIDLLIHCGDWTTPFSMRTYTKLNCPIKAVLGNGDPDVQKFQYQLQNLPILKDLKLDLHPRFQDFTVDGKRIGIFHGDDETLNKALIESQLYDVFCIGHDHTPKVETVDKTLIINPGSLIGYKLETGEIPITFAIYDTTSHSAQLLDLEKIKSN